MQITYITEHTKVKTRKKQHVYSKRFISMFISSSIRILTKHKYAEG